MSEQTDTDRKITCKTLMDYGTISSNSKQGWAKCLKLVSWNDKPAKFDLREWNGEKASKGLTFTREEIRNLRDILNTINLDTAPAESAAEAPVPF